MAQLLHLYMTTRKTTALTIWTFVGKVMSLPFNMLSRFVKASFQGASFNFMNTVTVLSDFGAQENKTCHCFHFFPPIFHQVAYAFTCTIYLFDLLLFIFDCAGSSLLCAVFLLLQWSRATL